MSGSSGITFGTTAAYAIIRLPYLDRIGFADIPVVGVSIVSPVDTGTITPIARQLVFRKLAECGVPFQAVKLVPTVGRSRRTRFKDENESSKTLGKNKMGDVLDYHFEIEREYVHLFQAKEGHCSFRGMGFPEKPLTYEQALQKADATAAGKCDGLALLAQTCATLDLVHAINPKLVYEGAVNRGLTASDVRRLGPVELGNLMFV